MNKIQSNELRVGNILLYKVHDELAEPKTQWVMHRIDHEDIALCHHSNEYFNDHYRAVELNHYLLEDNCGFELDDSDAIGYIAYSIYKHKDLHTHITYRHDLNSYYLGNNDMNRFNHLHQLQNIFFPLNNFQELPINLEP